MNLKELAKNIRNGNHPNAFYYKNKRYVLDYYDMGGFYMSYGSKQAGKDINIHTPNNRYTNNYKNMMITVEDKICYNLYVNYVGYQIRQCAHAVPRIYFKVYNPHKNKCGLVPSITVPQALEYFGIN